MALRNPIAAPQTQALSVTVSKLDRIIQALSDIANTFQKQFGRPHWQGQTVEVLNHLYDIRNELEEATAWSAKDIAATTRKEQEAEKLLGKNIEQLTPEYYTVLSQEQFVPSLKTISTSFWMLPDGNLIQTGEDHGELWTLVENFINLPEYEESEGFSDAEIASIGYLMDRGWVRVNTGFNEISIQVENPKSYKLIESLLEKVDDPKVKVVVEGLGDFGYAHFDIQDFQDNNFDLKKTVRKVKKASDWVTEHGEFSKPGESYFHAFQDIKYLLKALETGEFGRSKLTSVGTENSYVPYWNQIWFKPKGLKLFPVFYDRDFTKYSEIKMELTERFQIPEPASAQVNQWNYLNEQEWYCPSKIKLDDIEVELVVYWDRADRLRQLGRPVDADPNREDIEKIQELCRKRGYKFTTFPREATDKFAWLIIDAAIWDVKTSTFQDKLVSFYELDYKRAMLSQKKFLGTEQRKENIQRQLEKKLMEVGHLLGGELKQTLQTWLNFHNLKDPDLMAETHLRFVREAPPFKQLDEAFKGGDKYLSGDIVDVFHYMWLEKEKHPKFKDFIHRFTEYLKKLSPEEYEKILSEVPGSHNPKVIENLGQKDLTDQITVNLFPTITFLSEVIGKVLSKSEIFALACEIYKETNYSFWKDFFDPKELGPARKRIEGALARLSDVGTLGNMIVNTNYAINITHQYGSILQWVEDETSENKSGDNAGLEKLLDSLTAGDFNSAWDAELEEIGVQG